MVGGVLLQAAVWGGCHQALSILPCCRSSVMQVARQPCSFKMLSSWNFSVFQALKPWKKLFVLRMTIIDPTVLPCLAGSFGLVSPYGHSDTPFLPPSHHFSNPISTQASRTKRLLLLKGKSSQIHASLYAVKPNFILKLSVYWCLWLL